MIRILVVEDEKVIREELHIFPCGNHGLGLATEETVSIDGGGIQKECQIWPELAIEWVNGLKRM